MSPTHALYIVQHSRNKMFAFPIVIFYEWWMHNLIWIIHIETNLALPNARTPPKTGHQQRPNSSKSSQTKLLNNSCGKISCYLFNSRFYFEMECELCTSAIRPIPTYKIAYLSQYSIDNKYMLCGVYSVNIRMYLHAKENLCDYNATESTSNYFQFSQNAIRMLFAMYI